MHILSRKTRSTHPADGIPPDAIPTPRREPSAPLFGMPDRDEALSFRNLPPENRDLLTAYPAAPAPDLRAFLAALAMSAAIQRRGCRILAGSRIMTAAEFAFEAAVGQNLAILADQAEVNR